MLDRAKISNKTLAESLGVVEATVSRWRQGKTAIDDASLEHIVNLLAASGIRVTMGWLRYGETPSERPAEPALQKDVRREPGTAKGAKSATHRKRKRG